MELSSTLVEYAQNCVWIGLAFFYDLVSSVSSLRLLHTFADLLRDSETTPSLSPQLGDTQSPNYLGRTQEGNESSKAAGVAQA